MLFSRKNTKELVGACAYVFDTIPKLLMSDTIFRFVRNESQIDGIFLWYLLNSDDLRKDIQNLATGSSGSMPNISKERLLSFVIILPPLALQQHFATIIERIERQKALVRHQMDASEALFQRLLQDSFGNGLSCNRFPQLT